MTITFDQAKELLSTSNRSELRDHAFGDREVYFEDAQGNEIAAGYYAMTCCDVEFNDGTCFSGEEARILIKMGKLINVERNDSQDDDHGD